MPTIAKNNLDVQLSLLEAKAGLTPTISWCAEAIKNPQVLRKLPSDEEQVFKELGELRKIKLSKKLFSLEKQTNKAMKKAKAFSVQKIIKKIKQAKEENGDVSELETKLAQTKSLDHLKEAKTVFSKLLNSSEYIKNKLFGHSCLPEDTNDPILISGKALDVEVVKMQNDIELFLRKLFHEVSVSEKIKSDNNKFDHSESKEDFFIDSLNNDSEPSKKKKNRLGQKARQQQWEKLYGKSANHLIREEKGRFYRKHETEYSQKQQDLHPSWKAKQEAKEKERNASFQGKKIKFSYDDDDE